MPQCLAQPATCPVKRGAHQSCRDVVFEIDFLFDCCIAHPSTKSIKLPSARALRGGDVVVEIDCLAHPIAITGNKASSAAV